MAELNLPKGSKFTFRSGNIFTTRDRLSTIAAEVSDAMGRYGVTAAMAQSGGGSISPWPGHLSGNISVYTPNKFKESEIKSRFQKEISSRVSILGETLAVWQAQTQAAEFVVAETSKDIKKNIDDASKGFGIGVGLASVAIISICGLYFLLKVK